MLGGGIFNLPLDFCAPTSCRTSIYPVFTGTSCAAPNVAGLLAVHLSHVAYRSDPIGMLTFIDILASGWDSDSGAGLVRGDPAPLALKPDAYEPDGGPSSATVLGSRSTSSTKHNIVPENDADWYRVQLIERSDLIVQTSGPLNDDTQIRVLDSNAQVVGTDNDSGSGRYSRVALTGLDAGTYYVSVVEDGRNDFIEEYSLSVVITAAPLPPPPPPPPAPDPTPEPAPVAEDDGGCSAGGSALIGSERLSGLIALLLLLSLAGMRARRPA